MAKGGQRCGAGRPGLHVKAEHCRSLDVRRLARENILRPGSWGWKWSDKETGEVLASIGICGAADGLTLSYAVNGSPVLEHIGIKRTACALGGSRPWFACPRCGGRVALLYLRGGRFKCRKCHDLRYASQSEDAMGRSWLKQQKLEARLGENWRRPKGMHRKTREAILAKVWACEEVREDALAAYCERVGFKLRG